MDDVSNRQSKTIPHLTQVAPFFIYFYITITYKISKKKKRKRTTNMTTMRMRMRGGGRRRGRERERKEEGGRQHSCEKLKTQKRRLGNNWVESQL